MSDGPGWLLRSWRNPAYRFVARFLLYLGCAALVYPFLVERFDFAVDGLVTATAKIEYYVLRLFSADVSVSDKLLVFGGFPVRIIEECTGAFEALIFAAAVVAFPTEWRKKATGLALGVPLIYLFNLFRIAVLIVIGRYSPSLFEFMHLYFWQATLILMITSVWLLWIFKVVRYEKETLPSHS